MEQRREIVEREDVKNFLARLREMKGSKRAITGGDLEIPVVFLELISENMYRYSKLLNRVRVRSVPGQARQTIAGTVPEAVWTEMCGAINELDFVFNQITLDGYKVAGFVPVCNSLLEDTVSNLDLAAWIIEMISESVAYAEDKAIVYGKGPASHMPTGIVTRLAQTAQPDGYPANAPAWIDLHETNIIKIDSADMTPAEFFSAFTLAAGNAYNRYARGRKFWAMNSKTYAQIQAKLITFTAEGELVSRLAGVMPITDGDVDVLEFIPDGDIIGGYGELYLWIERGAMTIGSNDGGVFFIQDNTVFRNPSVYQINTPQSYFYSEVYDHFTRQFPNANVVFIEATQGSKDKAEFIKGLKDELRDRRIAFKSLKEDATPESLAATLVPGKSNIFIPTSGSNLTLIKILPQLTLLVRNQPEHEIHLFGYPEWQTYTKDHLDTFFELDTYFYSSFYTNNLLPAAINFTRSYRRWYRKDMEERYPKYGMLGFDTGFFFLKGLSRFGTDLENNLDKMNLTPIQTGFKFQRVNNWGGFVNKKVFFVRFTKNYELVKLDFD